MPTICEQLLPTVRFGFRSAARKITEGQSRGSRGYGRVCLITPKGTEEVMLGLAYGPHRDQSGDSTIFVTVSGSIVRDDKLKQALANEFGYIRVRHTTTPALRKTEYYVTLKPELIAKIAQGEEL